MSHSVKKQALTCCVQLRRPGPLQQVRHPQGIQLLYPVWYLSHSVLTPSRSRKRRCRRAIWAHEVGIYRTYSQSLCSLVKKNEGSHSPCIRCYTPHTRKEFRTCGARVRYFRCDTHRASAVSCVLYVTFRHERAAVGPATPPASTSATHPIQKRVAGTGSRHKICPHGRRRTMCRICGGRSLCEHKNQRNHCAACRGQGIKKHSFCRHNRQRSRCVKCQGVGICEHKRERYRCSICKAKEAS